MEFLLELWLPIVVAAIVLHVASTIAWTVLPHHQADLEKADNEDGFMDFVEKLNLAPGRYFFPYMEHKDHKDPAAIARYTKGPRGVLDVYAMPSMGRNILLTLVYFLIVTTVTGYIAWEAMGALPADARFMKAFQITGAIGVLVFGASGQLHAIWFPRKTLLDFVDGIVFGILMGLVFGFFWPAIA